MVAEKTGNELKEYKPSDAKIAKWNEFMSLTVKDFTDKAGTKKVHEARMVVAEGRREVEKIRKNLKQESLEYGRKVDGEANRLFDLITPIEEHLKKEEGKIEAEKKRVREEAAQKEKERIEERVSLVVKSGMRYDSMSPRENTVYLLEDLRIDMDEIKSLTDEKFDSFVEKVVAQQKKIDEKIIADEKEEEARLKKEKKERDEFEEKQRKQKEKEEELQKKEDKLNEEIEKRENEEAEKKAQDESDRKNKKYKEFLKKNGVTGSEKEKKDGTFIIDRDGGHVRLYKLVDEITIK